jgi:hypothetical protein
VQLDRICQDNKITVLQDCTFFAASAKATRVEIEVELVDTELRKAM